MMHYCTFLHEFLPIPLRFLKLELLFCYFSLGMAARASGDSNHDGDDGQPDAPIQQQIGFPSIQMIMADAAGNGGRVATGGATEVVENLPAPDVLPMTTTVTITNAAKISLRTYFTSANWPLYKALHKGIAFLDSTLGNIMSEFHLVRSQVAVIVCQ
jgi:hypothetical protein